MNTIKLKADLESFFNEDLGAADLTSEAIFAPGEQGSGTYTAKAPGIICGLPVVASGFELFDPQVEVHPHVNEGDRVEAGDDIITVHGSIRSLLSAERVLLNLLQRMSGIATMTDKAAQIVKGTRTRVTDTRKTTPGLRMFEKYAVTVGGGFNHRFGLYDAVMIKDNHIAYSGSIAKAVQKVRAKLGHTVKIEVETTCPEEVREAVQAKPDIIMFDNLTPEQILHLIPEVPEWIVTEASGGIDLSNLASYAGCGVDYISLGCLTHSVRALDISFNLVSALKGAEPQKGVIQ
ncbi:carboxylating nicotinate-nucleotide diphosphorylase [Sporolactobacillus sp. THM7-4]|nr:carboxylating nicotinate-nucleotide diphosphorylase [Sporolactobacillus sp. THM7-4]